MIVSIVKTVEKQVETGTFSADILDFNGHEDCGQPEGERYAVEYLIGFAYEMKYFHELDKAKNFLQKLVDSHPEV